MTISTTTAAHRSIEEVEHMAAQMARFPGDERTWAIERIRILTDADWLDDAAVRRLVRAVLAGLDLAEQRRRAVR
jgi:hypothetical protein